jgi:hypothetical protein
MAEFVGPSGRVEEALDPPATGAGAVSVKSRFSATDIKAMVSIRVLALPPSISVLSPYL